MKTAERRFLDKIKISKSDCWLWQACKIKCKKISYGQFWNGKKLMLAHRFSYEYYVGALVDGLTIDHQCNNGLCVNPSHLKQMTLRENIFRSNKSPSALNSKKTFCDNGHEFTKENTQIWGSYRQCKKCKRIFDTKKRAKLRERRKLK